QILSIIDLKKFYNLPQKKTSNYNLAIILHCNEMEFGILADALLGVTSIPINTVQTSLPMLTDISVKHLKGITQERVIILDGERILNDEKLIIT
ncbi:MAG: chemotaxis protein CheW, partial [bacterium]